MKSSLAILTVLWTSSVVLGGNVTYTAPAADQVLEPGKLQASEFKKADADAGTLSPSAVVAALKPAGQGQEPDAMATDALTARRLLLQAAMASMQVALDSSKAGGKEPDVIRFDFTGEGKFDKGLSVPLKMQGAGATFGPAVLQVKRGAVTMPVSVEGTYTRARNGGGETRRVEVSLLTAIQADVKFGDNSRAVRLVDGNGNFKFTDAARAMEKGNQIVAVSPGDTIVIDTGDGKFGRGAQLFPYGQPVRVDGKWYKVSLAKDRSNISAEPLDLPTATVKVDMPLWTCKLASKSGVLYLRGGKEPLEVPAGDYFLLDYTVLGPAGNVPAGAPHPTISGTGQAVAGGEVKPVSLAADKETALPIGGPLKAGITANLGGQRDVQFSFWLTDCGGHKIGDLVGGKGKPPAPQLSVVDASGKEVYKNTLEYG